MTDKQFRVLTITIMMMSILSYGLFNIKISKIPIVGNIYKAGKVGVEKAGEGAAFLGEKVVDGYDASVDFVSDKWDDAKDFASASFDCLSHIKRCSVNAAMDAFGVDEKVKEEIERGIRNRFNRFDIVLPLSNGSANRPDFLFLGDMQKNNFVILDYSQFEKINIGLDSKEIPNVDLYDNGYVFESSANLMHVASDGYNSIWGFGENEISRVFYDPQKGRLENVGELNLLPPMTAADVFSKSNVTFLLFGTPASRICLDTDPYYTSNNSFSQRKSIRCIKPQWLNDFYQKITMIDFTGNEIHFMGFTSRNILELVSLDLKTYALTKLDEKDLNNKSIQLTVVEHGLRYTKNKVINWEVIQFLKADNQKNFFMLTDNQVYYGNMDDLKINLEGVIGDEYVKDVNESFVLNEARSLGIHNETIYVGEKYSDNGGIQKIDYGIHVNRSKLNFLKIGREIQSGLNLAVDFAKDGFSKLYSFAKKRRENQFLPLETVQTLVQEGSTDFKFTAPPETQVYKVRIEAYQTKVAKEPRDVFYVYYHETPQVYLDFTNELPGYVHTSGWVMENDILKTVNNRENILQINSPEIGVDWLNFSMNIAHPGMVPDGQNQDFWREHNHIFLTMMEAETNTGLKFMYKPLGEVNPNVTNVELYQIRNGEDELIFSGTTPFFRKSGSVSEEFSAIQLFSKNGKIVIQINSPHSNIPYTKAVSVSSQVLKANINKIFIENFLTEDKIYLDNISIYDAQSLQNLHPYAYVKDWDQANGKWKATIGYGVATNSVSLARRYYEFPKGVLNHATTNGEIVLDYSQPVVFSNMPGEKESQFDFSEDLDTLHVHLLNNTLKIPNPNQSISVNNTLDFVCQNPEGFYEAHFGYNNTSGSLHTIKAGPRNYFHYKGSQIFDLGQTESFQPKRKYNAFFIEFDGSNLVWNLNGRTETANQNQSNGTCKLSVSPVLESICTLPDGTFRSYWGYNNKYSREINIPIGAENKFTGTISLDAGQPERFESARNRNVFFIDWTGNTNLVWKLGSRTATASSSKSKGLCSGL